MADDAKPNPTPQATGPAATAPASTDKATVAASSSSLSWEDEEATVPDISAVLAKLSLDEGKKKQEDDVKDKTSRRRGPVPPPPQPPAATSSKASTWQQPKPEPSARAPATPVQRRKPPSHQHAQATPSPTLSRYGAELGNIRDVVRDLPPEDVLAHGLYLWGFSFSSSSSAIEREALTSPWTAVGALITWLPPHDTCAVAMFYSIPTANRALRQVQAPAGVTAQSLKRASSEVQQQALAAGLAIPPRPKGDTAVPSRLILGALGIRSPSSTRPSIDGAAAGRVRRSNRIREQQEAAAAAAKRGGGEGDDRGSWGDG